MLTYSFADLQGESMYAHLYKCIKNDITNGVLHAEEKLPSKRMLAKNLGISLITVENAYAQLVVEGYIYSQPKRGYYVARIEQQPLPVKAERKAAPSLKPQATAQSVSFAKSSVPPDTFPYNIWARLLRNTLTTADEHALISDTSAGGVLPLRQALARHLYQFRGLNIAPEQIIIGSGTQTLYNLIVQLLGRSHVYALENPGYPQLAAAYQANDVFCRDFEQRLVELLGTKVKVQPKPEEDGRQGGTIQIEYYSAEDLERIYEVLQQGHEDELPAPKTMRRLHV